LAANLYARSVFGEDALVNISVERKDEGDVKLSGYIRIRSKTQGSRYVNICLFALYQWLPFTFVSSFYLL
jgi:hypothetical protein